MPPNPYRNRLVARMRELAVEHPRRGHHYIMDLLDKEGWPIGPRLMKRLWHTEGLLVPQKRRKRRRIGTGENGIVSDHTSDGRALRMLVVLDECTRKCLAIEVGRHCRGHDVVRMLDDLTAIRGRLAHIRSDNGLECDSAAVRKWCEASGTGTLYIAPGSP